MKYEVMLEKTMTASFIVEADDEDLAIKLAEDQAREHPEEFEDNGFYFCLVEQWKIDDDGNYERIY